MAPGYLRAFIPGKILNAGKSQEIISTLYGVSKDGRGLSSDVGLRENTSRIMPSTKTHGGATDPSPDIPDPKYIRNQDDQDYFQAQDWGLMVRPGSIKNRSREEWLAGVDRKIAAPSTAIRASSREPGRSSNTTRARAIGLECHSFPIRRNIGPAKNPMRVVGENGLPEYLCSRPQKRVPQRRLFDKVMFHLRLV